MSATINPNRLRTVRLSPYRAGHGPVFTLTTWDTGRRDSRGSTYQRYRLTVSRDAHWPDGTVIFEGDDYSPSLMHCSDSDAAIEGLLGFLTVRPGDTDPEFFKDYTDTQRRFCDLYAEALSAAVQSRFCDEDGNVRKD